MTSKPKNQQNVNALLSRAAREATGPRPLPDVAASNQHYSSPKRSQTRNNSQSVSDLDNLWRPTQKVTKTCGLTYLNSQSLIMAHHQWLALELDGQKAESEIIPSNWPQRVENINLLMVSVICSTRAIPLNWRLLPHLGNSNQSEQESVLSPVLSRFKDHQIVGLGDREFCSLDLAKWLEKRNIGFCLR